jgi:hypothetical protein
LATESRKIRDPDLRRNPRPDHTKWAADLPAIQTIVNAANARAYLALKKWGDVDPLYKAAVERYPNPDAQA